LEIDCDPRPPRCSVPARRPSWRTKRRAPRKYVAPSASDLAPLIGHRRLRRLRQPFASPEGEGLEPRRGQSSCQSSGIGEPVTICPRHRAKSRTNSGPQTSQGTLLSGGPFALERERPGVLVTTPGLRLPLNRRSLARGGNLRLVTLPTLATLRDYPGFFHP